MGSCVNGVSGVSDGQMGSSAEAVWLKARAIITEALMEVAESYCSAPIPLYSKPAVQSQCQHNAAAIIARLAQKDLLIVKASELDEADRRKAPATPATVAGDYPNHTGLYTLGVLMLGMAVIFGSSWFLFDAVKWVAGWIFVPMAIILTIWSILDNATGIHHRFCTTKFQNALRVFSQTFILMTSVVNSPSIPDHPPDFRLIYIPLATHLL